MTATSAIPTTDFSYFYMENTVSSKNFKALEVPKNTHNEQSSNSVTWTKSFQMFLEVLEVIRESSTPNWDGYDALPLKANAAREAVRFIEIMPIWIPEPDIAPLPNGDIGFQWHFGKFRILTVSLSGKNIVIYASILGSLDRKKNGSEYFNDSIPEEVLKIIAQIGS